MSTRAGGTQRTGQDWRDDVLGPGWSALTLDLGEEHATLVRRDVTRRPVRGSVLYVHGFNDYFFAEHLGRAWADRGYRFYAVDLRRHGRSLAPGQLANHTTDLAEYFEDLDAAVAVVREAAPGKPFVLHGHSTGGLLASLWSRARGEDGPDLLVLNSPWFELNASWFDRHVLAHLVDVLGLLVPRLPVRRLAPYYTRSLHRQTGGEWEFNLAWKPFDAFPARAGFVRAVRQGHRAVRRGLDLRCPVLVCCSTESGPTDEYHTRLDRTDSVLDVQHIVARSARLGRDVTIRQIDGGVHDLALSPHRARTTYLDTILDWTDARLGVRPRRAVDPEATVAPWRTPAGRPGPRRQPSARSGQ